MKLKEKLSGKMKKLYSAMLMGIVIAQTSMLTFAGDLTKSDVETVLNTSNDAAMPSVWAKIMVMVASMTKQIQIASILIAGLVLVVMALIEFFGDKDRMKFKKHAFIVIALLIFIVSVVQLVKWIALSFVV